MLVLGNTVVSQGYTIKKTKDKKLTSTYSWTLRLNRVLKEKLLQNFDLIKFRLRNVLVLFQMQADRMHSTAVLKLPSEETVI